MHKIFLSVISAAALMVSTAGFSDTLSGLGIGAAHDKNGYALDLNYAQGQGAMIHGQIGQTDQHFKDQKQNVFVNADYDLIAPVSRNVAVYAGAGLADTATRGPSARLPLGVMATFDALPVQVAYEMTPSVKLVGDDNGKHGTFMDHSLAVRYLIK